MRSSTFATLSNQKRLSIRYPTANEKKRGISTERMKILAISHSCVVAQYQKRMAEVAGYPDVELTLLVPKYWFQFNKNVMLEKGRDDHYRIVSIQPITWGMRGKGLRNVTHIYSGMKRILEEIKPDIVELWEEPFSGVTAHTIFWAKRIVPKAKVIFFSAQNILKRYPFPFSTFENYTYRNAQFAFLMNREVAEVVRGKGYEKNFTILPLGVDTDIFCKKDASLLKKEIGLGDFVIGFIGKITQQKGILDLIEAVSRIDEKIQLLIIGNGDLREEVERRMDLLGLGQKTVIMDGIPHSRVPDYLNCMDLLVFPSVTVPHLKEQFGRVIVEGMACEVPVIGSDSGQIPGTIGKAGLIFKETDVRDLREKIATLMNDQNLRTVLARKGRKRVLGNFTWKVIAKKQYQVYRELMSKEQ